MSNEFILLTSLSKIQSKLPKERDANKNNVNLSKLPKNLNKYIKGFCDSRLLLNSIIKND